MSAKRFSYAVLSVLVTLTQAMDAAVNSDDSSSHESADISVIVTDDDSSVEESCQSLAPSEIGSKRRRLCSKVSLSCYCSRHRCPYSRHSLCRAMRTSKRELAVILGGRYPYR